MASIIDELLAREGTVLPNCEGLNLAFAGGASWTREPDAVSGLFTLRRKGDSKDAEAAPPVDRSVNMNKTLDGLDLS
jgi:hypothetical protein